MNGLQSHNLLLEDNRTKESLKLENDACEQLALDLGMSSHVFASKTFSRLNPTSLRQAQTFEDAVADMSLATGALSIDAPGPPPVHFGFLTPITAGPGDHSPNIRPENPGTPRTEETELVPLGVQLLIDEWKIGEDPKDYKYFDPYSDDIFSQAEPKRRVGEEPLPALNAQSQQIDMTARLNPPTVLVARAPPLIDPSRNAVVREREKTPAEGGFTQGDPLQTQGSSQDVIMVSTQVEPGKFGDRKTGQKKRQKRVGGF